MVFQYILISVAVILIGYSFILGVLALVQKPEMNIKPAFKHSFLIIIYCRNSEKGLVKTMYSLAGLIYPWNLYDIIVFADECNDDIATISEKLGTKNVKQTSSGDNSLSDILRWAAEQINRLDEEYDAIVFVRANDLISGKFLTVMNRYLEGGSAIIQSANRKFSELTTWKIKYKRICWSLRTFVEALGRKKIGLKAELLGSGTCFKTKVLKENQNELQGQFQNLENGFLLLTQKLRVTFAPEATIWSPLGQSSWRGSKRDQPKQRFRQFKELKKHVRYVVNPTKGNWSLLERFDLLLGASRPPVMLSFMVIAANCVINVLLWKIFFLSSWFWVIWALLLVMLVIYFSIGAVADKDGSFELSNGNNINLPLNLMI